MATPRPRPSEAQRDRLYDAIDRLQAHIARADLEDTVRAAMRQIAGALDGYPVEVQYAAILFISWRIGESLAACPEGGA